MNMPEFTAEVSLHKLNGSYTIGLVSSEGNEISHIHPTTWMGRVQSFGLGDPGRFDPTLPSCRWEWIWEESAGAVFRATRR